MATFAKSYSDAMLKLRLSDRRRPDEVFPRFKKEDFDALKKKYNDEFGYFIRIPKLDEIIHTKPTLMKTYDEIKREKREGLMRILASPSYEWSRWYTTAMTFLDNIQDATSVVYPAISMLARWSPKVFGRAIPIVGWVMLGTDALDLAIRVGRLPMTGFGGKRLHCEIVRHNPFGKRAQYLRKERLRNYKPGLADALQVLQTTDQFTGVGLNLGPIMGTVMDAVLGGYRYLNGERVRITQDVPDMWEHEQGGRKAMTSAGFINSTGQTFSEEMHFWSLVMGAVGARLFTPAAHELDPVGAVEDPMSIMVPAPVPTDPVTLDVIKEEGLSVEDGIGWPYNQKRQIMVGDLWDELVPRCREGFRDYCFRHSHDWYGFVVASCWDQVLPSVIWAFDPTGEVQYEDTNELRTIFRMLKAPLLPVSMPPPEKANAFVNWINFYYEFYHKTPGIMAIKAKFEELGIPYEETYPVERTPEADESWPPDLDLSAFNMAT